MKKNILFFCLIVYSFLELSFHKIERDTFQSEIFVRIVNESKFELTNISLFSLKFNDLNLYKASRYKVLNFNKNSDDSMLYLTANNKHFALYVSPGLLNGEYSYIIDSLSLEKRYVFITKIKD